MRRIRPMTIESRQFREGQNRNRTRIGRLLLLGVVLMAGASDRLLAQDTFQTQSEGVVTISRGSAAVLTRPDTLTIVHVADETIASADVLGPTQIVIRGISVGSTTLVLWGRFGPPRMYTIEVTADVASFQRQLNDLFPGAGLTVTSSGSTLVLSGVVRDPAVIRSALELAESQSIPVVNHVQSPAPEQILLQVEFAEVSKSVVKEMGGDLLRIVNPEDLGEAGESESTHTIETLSEGFITLAITGENARVDAVIRALKNTGEYRSLAEPNLVTREGEEASFLAGGEFPFPSIQGGGGGENRAVTIQFREFGIRLTFTPTITNSGNVRLQVAPEVSSLDFANGLTYEGFSIPTILARRVETDVELRPGQTLAIGGLLDNSLTHEVDRIPILGDIPILGYFFRSTSARQDRTELLVLVTPHILDSENLPAPAVPTGAPEGWEWDSHIRNWIRERPDTTRRSGASGGTGS
jgi:pilus assembly protein CpaC